MYLSCGFYIFGRKGGLIAMPRMSKKRKQEWALFLNERNRITVGGLCRKCRNDCKPPAALTEPAEQVPKGAEPARHRLSLPLWCLKGGLPCAALAIPAAVENVMGGLPALSPAAPAFSFLFCPLSPQPPSPPGKGEIFSLFCRGLRPRHPGIKPPAALTKPAEQVPEGG